MKCKYCHTPLDWGETICPECGRENKRPKKKSSGVIWVICILALVVVAALAALVVLKTRDTNSSANQFEGLYSEFTVPDRNYTVTDEEMDAQLGNTVVAQCNGMPLDNATLSYYYWHAYYSYSVYLAGAIDTSKGLDEQSYGDYTWQQLLLDQALITWEECQALAAEAEKLGGEILDTCQEYLDQTLQNIQENVDENDQFETIDEYLKYYYGPAATVENYTEYARTSQLANLYAQHVADNISYTDADIDGYFNEHLSDYLSQGIEKSDVSNVTVRHILIQPEDTEDDASWEEARKKAEDILAQWEAGEATEDSFAQLAEEYSEDPGSATNGGLYEEVAPDEMVEAFDEWCFDASRESGDTGIVETPYGYHVMYFVETTGNYNWFETAKSDYIAEKQNDQLLEVLQQYQYELDFNKMALITSPIYGG